ncbi:MAG TPA: hypothetical protein VEV85_19450, partial [Bryobacteraceae bacterium]|nr:hypothetical protein [Bryobacteraceae bacterium]
SLVPQPVRDELAKLGHEIRVSPLFSYAMGRGNAVMVDGKGVIFGASDPRGDGAAVPQAFVRNALKR